MKLIPLLIFVLGSVVLVGCGQQVLPDATNVKRKMPPGWKPTGDVMLHVTPGK